MKNKKGFTLIELLAVIVILAIIALIAVPIILNMINSARKSAARSAALGYIDAIEYNNGFASLGSDAEVSGYTAITSGDVSEITSTLGSHLKGKAPTSGSVVIDANGKVESATNLCFNGYAVSYNGKDAKVEGSCSSGVSEITDYSTKIYYYQDDIGAKTTTLPSTWKNYVKETDEYRTATTDIYEYVIPGSETSSSDLGYLTKTLDKCHYLAESFGISGDTCKKVNDTSVYYELILTIDEKEVHSSDEGVMFKSLESCQNTAIIYGVSPDLCVSINPPDVYEFVITKDPVYSHSQGISGYLYNSLQECQEELGNNENYANTNATCEVVYRQGSKYLFKTAEICLNNTSYGGELCFKSTEDYEVRKQKLLNYFNYDKNTWSHNSNKKIWYNPDRTITIDFPSSEDGVDKSSNFSNSDRTIYIYVIPTSQSDINVQISEAANGDKTWMMCSTNGSTESSSRTYCYVSTST